VVPMIICLSRPQMISRHLHPNGRECPNEEGRKSCVEKLRIRGQSGVRIWPYLAGFLISSKFWKAGFIRWPRPSEVQL